jgi:hypothetical protein
MPRSPLPREQQDEEERKRDRLAALFFLLFPLMIAAGFMVPGFVSAVSDGNGVRVERVAIADPAPAPVELDHTPLRVPRNFGKRVGTIELEDLFSKELVKRFSGGNTPRESSFESSQGGTIVLEEVTPQERVVSFDDATPPDDATRIELQINDDQRDWLLDEVFDGDTAWFEDTEGSPLPVVPEPGTGGLLAFGGLAMGVARRLRR